MSDKNIDKEDEHLVMDLDLDVDSSIFDDEESKDDSAVSLVEDSINSSIIKEILLPVSTDIIPESYNYVLFSSIMISITFLLIVCIVGLDELIGLNCEEIGCNCGHPFIINGIYDLLNGSS